MKKIFNDILFYAELTTCRDRIAYINKWQSYGYHIDFNLAEYLVKCNVVEFDSGNWETGENHFRLEILSSSILERINFLRDKIDSSTVCASFPYSKNKMLKDISEIELQYSRKIKLKKLKNIYEE